MRTLIAALGFSLGFLTFAAPALAQSQPQTIAPSEAQKHVGQTVTVEGPVGNVYGGRSGAVFIDIGGRFPDNPFTAVIFPADAGKFPAASALAGRTIAVNGVVQLYRNRPEIVLRSAGQLRTR
jgi:DNA/RNA endonuclease YhcR with UshA esterase domain